MDIKKGQIVWVWINREGVKETKILTRGKKYITLEYDPRIKFNAETLQEINGTGCLKYIILDMDKYISNNHYNHLKNELRKFNWDMVESETLDLISKMIF